MKFLKTEYKCNLKNKNIIILCSLIAFLTISKAVLGQINQQGFILTATVTGAEEGQMVYLRTQSSLQLSVDSAVVNDGKFKFSGNTNTPQLYIITFQKNNNSQQRYNYAIPVFIENKQIMVTAKLDSNTTELELIYLSGYPYKNITVTGSPSNDLFQKYAIEYERLEKKHRIAYTSYLNYLKKKDEVKTDSILPGIKVVNEIDRSQEMVLEYVKSFIKEYNSSPVALFVASKHINKYSIKGIDRIMSCFTKSTRMLPDWKVFSEKVEFVKKSAVGAKFIDHNFTDTIGQVRNIASYLGKGNYILLEFWASWCGPCRYDIPHLKEVYKLYNPLGFQVVSVSIDEQKDSWIKAVNEERMNWQQLLDLKGFDGALSNIYNFDGIPACILIDPKGIIVSRNMRGSWMDEKLIQLFGNQFS